MMYKQIIISAAALLSFAAAGPVAERANPDQIVLGHLMYPHGNQFIAWAPSKTTQEQACKTHVSVSPSFQPPISLNSHELQAVVQTNNSGFPDRPICGSPFSVGNLKDVSLKCQTSPVTPTTSDVVAVLSNKGKKIENCVPAVGDYFECDHTGTGLRQEFICTWEA